ncbi:MAG: alpha/beta hydrolase [Chloroflexota bacterium]
MSIVFLKQSAVHYESLGRGRPVVFLHTWVGSWRYWVPSLQVAATSSSAYALDLSGFGDTARSPGAYSLEHRAALVGGFLDEMGIGRIALVGHGLGALAGLSFAGLDPSRLARIMAIAMPLDPLSVDGRLQSSSPAELLDLLAGRSANAADVLVEPSEIDPRALKLTPDVAQIHAGFAGLRDANIPCLLVYGANDPLLRPPSPEHTTTFGSNVHQIVLADCGHFPMLDSPDAFHRLLLDFLAMEPGTSPRGLQPKEEWRRRLR